MSIIIFFLGVFVMAIGFGYVYRPDKVQKFNTWMKENVFSDRLLLMHRRKAGVLLIFVGAVIVYFAIR